MVNICTTLEQQTPLGFTFVQFRFSHVKVLGSLTLEFSVLISVSLVTRFYPAQSHQPTNVLPPVHFNNLVAFF